MTNANTDLRRVYAVAPDPDLVRLQCMRQESAMVSRPSVALPWADTLRHLGVAIVVALPIFAPTLAAGLLINLWRSLGL